MKDEQIIALYFARNEDAIGETDKKYGARLLQLAQRILLDQFACEEVRSDTYLKTWNAIPPQRPPVFPAFLSRLTRQGAIDRYRPSSAECIFRLMSNAVSYSPSAQSVTMCMLTMPLPRCTPP